MAFLTPNTTYKMNGVIVNEKIIPDGTVWKDDAKARKCGYKAGSLFKAQKKLSNGTGAIKGVTIHNTNRGNISNQTTLAEQYTRATYNENMNDARVHYYVCNSCAWQTLKAGTGLSVNDPLNNAEIAWHASDGSKGMGNTTTIAFEMIMNGSGDAYDKAVENNGAKMAAWILFKNNLTVENLYTHTYFMNRVKKISGTTDFLNTYKRPGATKYCPAYILPHWASFKALVSKYIEELKNPPLKKGDGNSDDKVNSTDYLLAKRAALGTIKISDKQKVALDINNNGKIDATDYLLIKRSVLGTYKIEEEGK